MIKFGRLAALAALIAGGFVFADAFARETPPVTRETPPAAKSTAAIADAPALRGSTPEPTGCDRKVKIVYGGHGEGTRAGCPVAGG